MTQVSINEDREQYCVPAHLSGPLALTTARRNIWGIMFVFQSKITDVWNNSVPVNDITICWFYFVMQELQY